jgi:hypothetical protein
VRILFLQNIELTIPVSILQCPAAIRRALALNSSTSRLKSKDFRICLMTSAPYPLPLWIAQLACHSRCSNGTRSRSSYHNCLASIVLWPSLSAQLIHRRDLNRPCVRRHSMPAFGRLLPDTSGWSRPRAAVGCLRN